MSSYSDSVCSLRWMTRYVFIVLLFSAAHALQCSDECVDKFTTHTEKKACEDGCRLAVVLSVANAQDTVPELCSDRCKQSFEGTAALEACSTACHLPVDMPKSQVVIREDEPAFDVVRNQMQNIFSRVLEAFPREEMHPMMENMQQDALLKSMNDMHRQMNEDMRRIMQWGNRLLNPDQSRPVSMTGHVVFRSRPHGHNMAAFQGPQVGNEGVQGSMIDSEPVLIHHHQHQPARTERWWSRLTSRARRLSVVSQWLVCAALVLCLVVMLSIAAAVLKQMRAQRYQSTPVVCYDKKSPPCMDYPLIHDTPPPAYDQLSIHKQAPSI